MSNQDIVQSLPLTGKVVCDLIIHTIESSASADEQKKLIKLINSSIKIPPIIGHIQFGRKEISDKKSNTPNSDYIEIYLSLEENHDVGAEITSIVKEFGLPVKDVPQLLNVIGRLTFLSRVYYNSIYSRIPDIFAKIKDVLHIEHDISNIYINADKHELYICETTKKIVPRLRIVKAIDKLNKNIESLKVDDIDDTVTELNN